MSNTAIAEATGYELKQFVKIRALDEDEGSRALITGVLLDGEGLTYRVVYWNQGVRRCEWVHPEEITRCD